ncbi:hypothetical protein B0H99_10354 [Planomicrobium soli]|uniref:Uncharacterized protein n=1 Tax=Planomicrobium soli TaxID=1176648 RepID=A0A2P8H3X5_9BACL|nr:hypothetical protein [Planomicrobium soli]PSL40922.1 hypothetical protein B0H99_10354 [Planomicrobium soli]
MDFMIAGKQGYIRIDLTEVVGFPDETSYLGGFDVKGRVEIKSGNYYVKDAELWFSTGQVYEFFVELQEAYQRLKGCATFLESDNNLNLSLRFNQFGQLNIQGHFQEVSEPENALQFEFESEQSYLISTLQQLQRIVDYYGD